MGKFIAVNEQFVMSGKAFEPLHGGKIKVTAGQQIERRLGIVAHGEDLAVTAERSAYEH